MRVKSEVNNMKSEKKYWVIADTHFGHCALKEYCNRPEYFDDKMLKNIASAMNSGDVLIHLGDVCIGHDSEWHEDLRYIKNAKNIKIRNQTRGILIMVGILYVNRSV